MTDPTKQWLLVTDVDQTLVGNDEGLAAFAEARGACPQLAVSLNSSRPTPSVQKTMESLAVNFVPDAMICAMGTEITIEGQPDTEWQKRFTGWDRAVIQNVMNQLGFEAHDAEFQTEYKASYAVPAGPDQQKAIDAIRQTGLNVRIVCSGASDFDVLPAGADKGDATLHVAKRFGIDRAHLLVSGDSANDLAMFRVCDKGIVVGNARAELKEAVDANRVYFASGACAAGILEGLQHWGVPIGKGDKP